MKKNLLLIITLLLFLPIGLYAQVDNSLWSHVGPISENLQNDNEFETGRLEMIAVNPNNEQEIFAGGHKTGLWYTTDGAENWTNVSTLPIGTNGVSAIAFNTNNELIIANRVDYQYDVLDRTTALFKYIPASNQWVSLGNIPIIGRAYTVNTIAIHPTNNNLILLGTSHGIYRSNNAGQNWSAINTANEYIQLIEFVYNNFSTQYDIYYTGTNISLSDSDKSIHQLIGEPIFARSTNLGLGFAEITVFANQLLSSYPITNIYGTTFCIGASNNLNELNFYMYTAKDITDPAIPALNIISKVTVNPQTGTSSCSILKSYNENNWNEVTTTRMAIAFDQLNDFLWIGATQIRYFNLTTSILGPLHYGFTNITEPNMVHADLHDVFISPNNPDMLYVVSDGGFYTGDLNTPNVFEHKNNGLHIAMINGFSGASKDPNYYVIGLHDIIYTSFYDQAELSNRHTRKTHENDGGVIDNQNNDLIIFDHSSKTEYYHVSTDGGATTTISANLSRTTLFGVNPFFQDPYRGRIYAGMKSMSLAQFNYDSNKFDIKKSLICMADYLPFNPDLSFQMMIIRMAFSRSNENSIHLITSTSTAASGPTFRSCGEVFQYIGNNFDDMLQDNNPSTEHYDSNGDHQWRRVSPEWTSLSNMGSGFTSVPDDELINFNYSGVVKSHFDDNVVYISMDMVPNNNGVKVLKFNNTTWEDYSTGIPSTEVTTAMINDPMSNDGFYLITESNIYYRDASMSSWMHFSNNMPKIFATQMEINNLERTIRAGTYGRGIWKSCLKCPESIIHNETATYTDPYTLIEGSEITSISTINPAKEVNYKANKIIRLKPGFKAKANSKFRAVIQSCTPQIKSSQVVIKPLENSIDLEEFIIEQSNIDRLEVYPNPSSEQFTVKFNGLTLDSQLKLVNIQGQVIPIKLESVSDGTVSFKLTGYPPGIYILTLQHIDKTYQSKIVLE